MKNKIRKYLKFIQTFHVGVKGGSVKKKQSSSVRMLKSFIKRPASPAMNVSISVLNFKSYFGTSVVHFVDTTQKWRCVLLNKQRTRIETPFACRTVSILVKNGVN